MIVYFKLLLACAILLAISPSIRAEYDVDSYCRLVKNNIRLASTDDCQTYYICENGKGIKGTCPTNQSFDKNLGLCRPSSQVYCYLGNDKPCQNKAEGFVPIVGTCNGYIWCKNYVEAGRGYCPNKLIFRHGECTYGGDCQDNINEGGQGMKSVCDIMPDNFYFGSTKDCKIWQRCDNDTLITGECPTGYVFDVPIESCNIKSGNMCSRVTGQDIQPDPTPDRQCNIKQKGLIEPDISICSAYYVCDGSKWVHENCSQGLYFSTVTQKCELRQTATPSKECNRCQFSKKLFVNAVDPSCSDYLICSNGEKKTEGSCGSKKYFDEVSQACIQDTYGRLTYSLKNGACFNCNATCGALDSSKCIPKPGCDCGLDKDNKTCVPCPDGVADGKCKVVCEKVCTALAGAKCTESEGCQCSLNEDKSCVEKKSCDQVCKAFEGEKCIQTGDCNCGLDTNKACVDCANAKCDSVSTADSCDEECKKLPLETCTSGSTKCTCNINDGACANCTQGKACNGCICLGSECTEGKTGCECYVDDQKKCIYCPLGIVESSNSKACKASQNK